MKLKWFEYKSCCVALWTVDRIRQEYPSFSLAREFLDFWLFLVWNVNIIIVKSIKKSLILYNNVLLIYKRWFKNHETITSFSYILFLIISLNEFINLWKLYKSSLTKFAVMYLCVCKKSLFYEFSVFIINSLAIVIMFDFLTVRVK